MVVFVGGMVLVDKRSRIMSLAVDAGRVVWTEDSIVAAAVPIDGGAVVELQRTEWGNPIGDGVAAAGGSAFFGVGRATPSLRAVAADGSSRDVATATLPPALSSFVASQVALDATRVYWFDNWYTAPLATPTTMVRSARR